MLKERRIATQNKISDNIYNGEIVLNWSEASHGSQKLLNGVEHVEVAWICLARHKRVARS